MTSPAELKRLTLLRSTELLQDMDSKHLKKLATLAREVEFEAGEVIYHRGNLGQAIYIIQSGEINLETDIPGQPSIILNTLGPGDIFGWSSLFPSERKMFLTRASQSTRVMAIDAGQIREAWQSDSELQYALLRRAGLAMANRIRMTRQQLAKMLVS